MSEGKEIKGVLIVKAINYAGKPFYFPQEVYDRTAALHCWRDDDQPFTYKGMNSLLVQLDTYNDVRSRLNLPTWTVQDLCGELVIGHMAPKRENVDISA